MKSDWTLAIVLWGILIGILAFLGIWEWRKTPQQRKEESQKAWERYEKHREEDKQRRREKRDNAPAKGCLESMFTFLAAGVLLMLAVIIGIMLLISSGD